VNGTTVYRVGAGFVSSVPGITYSGENSKYYKFNVAPGTWHFLVRSSSKINNFYQIHSRLNTAFANPCSRQFSFSVPENTSVKLYSVNGVTSKEISAVKGVITINTNTLTNGIYLIKDNAGNILKKIVILQ
jgi:hypothetical protein